MYTHRKAAAQNHRSKLRNGHETRETKPVLVKAMVIVSESGLGADVSGALFSFPVVDSQKWSVILQLASALSPSLSDGYSDDTGDR